MIEKTYHCESISETTHWPSILERFGSSDYKPAPTPGSGLEISVKPEGATFLDDKDTKTCQAMVRSLIYLRESTV